jgi:hypothetical protein
MVPMKTSFGMKLAVFVLFLLCAGSAVLSLRLTFAVQALEKRAAATREAVDGLVDAANARDEIEAASTKVATSDGPSKQELETLMLKLRAVSRRLDALEAGDIEDLGIETLIDRKLLEKMPRGGPVGRRFAKLDDVGERIGLSDAQKRHAAEVIDRAKEDVLEVLRAKDEDGMSMSERIAARVKGPGTRQEKTRGIMTDLFERSVPGTDESYFTAMSNSRQKAISDFKHGLTDAQLSAFGGLGIDVFGIETGYSPFAEEVKSAMTGNQ